MSKPGPKPKPLLARVVKTNTCWLWTGYVARDGYGRYWAGDKPVVAHRAVYGVLVGEVPAGKQLDHLCRNRTCVNPTHLEPVTQRENILRGSGLAANNSKKTNCPLGHEYSGTNSRGNRVCNKCMTIASNKLKEKQHV